MLNPAAVSLLVTQLHAFVRVRMPLAEALRYCAESSRDRAVHRAVGELTEAMQRPAAANDGRRRSAPVLPPLVTAIFTVGCASGTLEPALGYLKEYCRAERKLQSTLVTTAWYAGTYLVAFALCAGILFTQCIPQFARMFEEVGLRLPFPTRLVLFGTMLVNEYYYLLGTVIFAGGLLLLRLRRFWPELRYRLDRMALLMPVFGELRQKKYVTMFCKLLQYQLALGVDLVTALENVRQSVDNLVWQRELDSFIAALRNGSTLAAAMAPSRRVPVLVKSLLAIGERGGCLAEELEALGKQYEADTRETARTLTLLIEPIMIALLGTVVGLIVTALFFPMFDLVDVVGN